MSGERVVIMMHCGACARMLPPKYPTFKGRRRRICSLNDLEYPMIPCAVPNEFVRGENALRNAVYLSPELVIKQQNAAAIGRPGTRT